MSMNATRAQRSATRNLRSDSSQPRVKEVGGPVGAGIGATAQDQADALRALNGEGVTETENRSTVERMKRLAITRAS